MRCAIDSRVDLAAWQAAADACPHATFFHTPIWLSAFVRSDPTARIATKRVRFDDGRTAWFPILERRKFGGLYRTAESSPASCYGGPVSADPLTPEHLRAAADAVRRRSANLVWRVNPLDPHAAELDPFRTTEDSTEILDLAPFADGEAVRAHFRHSTRKQIAKGVRAGLTARVAESWEEWEQYYRLYEARLLHWGKGATNHYPLPFFRALYEARGPRIALHVVEREGRIAGGNLNFYHGRHCVEWHAAYDAELFACGVRDFLVDHIVRDAWARGFAWYDFNPSGGHEGSRRFKQTFGTTSRPSHLILIRRGLYRLDRARHLARALRGRKQPAAAKPEAPEETEAAAPGGN